MGACVHAMSGYTSVLVSTYSILSKYVHSGMVLGRWLWDNKPVGIDLASDPGSGWLIYFLSSRIAKCVLF